jgi:hypothetical protein
MVPCHKGPYFDPFLRGLNLNNKAFGPKIWSKMAYFDPWDGTVPWYHAIKDPILTPFLRGLNLNNKAFGPKIWSKTPKKGPFLTPF